MNSTPQLVDRQTQVTKIGKKLIKAETFRHPIGYYDEDYVLRRIVPMFSESETSFFSVSNTVQVEILKNASEEYNLKYRTDDDFEAWLDLREITWSDDDTTAAAATPLSNAMYALASTDIVRSIVFPGVIDEFILQRGKVKRNIVLYSRPKIADDFHARTIEIAHHVKTSEPITFETFTGEKRYNFQTPERFSIVTDDGRGFVFDKPTLVDANGNRYRVWYRIGYISPMEFDLFFVIDAETVLGADVAYPLVIDPTATSKTVEGTGVNVSGTFQIDFPQTCNWIAHLCGKSSTYDDDPCKLNIINPAGTVIVNKSSMTGSSVEFTGSFNASANDIGPWTIKIWSDNDDSNPEYGDCTVYYSIPEVVGTVKFRSSSTTYAAHAVKTTDTLTPVVRVQTTKGVGAMRLLKAGAESPWMVRISGATRGVRTTDMPPDCGGSCTGGCYTGCSTGCKNTCKGTCTGSCTGTCSGKCTATCADNCEGDCKSGCQSCTGTCTDACTSCTGGCTDKCTSCTGTCSGMCGEDPCGGECVGTCSGTCSSCTGGCTDSCTGCSGNCTSCTGTCTGNCDGTCHATCADYCRGSFGKD